MARTVTNVFMIIMVITTITMITMSFTYIYEKGIVLNNLFSLLCSTGPLLSVDFLSASFPLKFKTRAVLGWGSAPAELYFGL